jgi:hypothetical protein
VSYARLVSGAVVTLGMLGMLETGWGGFADAEGSQLLRFTVNPLTNVLHLALGLVGVAMALAPEGSRRYLIGAGALLTAWGVIGFAVQGSASDPFASNGAMNAAHLASGLIALALALWPGRRTEA